jgi:hypothetical protein
MQILGPASNTAAGDQPAFALGVDTSAIITKCLTVKEARTLPCGSVVGDLHGGLTFSDSVAAALEARSIGGWRELNSRSSDTWTVIVLDR